MSYKSLRTWHAYGDRENKKIKWNMGVLEGEDEMMRWIRDDWGCAKIIFEEDYIAL